MKISAIEGNSQWLDGGSMFGNAPRAVWEKWVEIDKLGRIPLSCRSLLVELGETKVLCEVGIGSFFEPKLAERFGVQDTCRHILTENLEKLGISEDEIDYVILSHLHFDHAGGLLPSWEENPKDDQELRFPNAKYIVGKAAWERALDPHPRDRASFLPVLNQALKSCGRLQVVDSQDDLPETLKPRLDLIFSDGHTPGQMLTKWTSGVNTVVFCGDLIPGLPWMHLPITMGYDRFPEKVIDEKSKFLDEAIAGNWLLFFTHDSEHTACFPCQDERGKMKAKKAFAKQECSSVIEFF